MDRNTLLTRLRAAREEIEAAEHSLDSVLSTLRERERAQKEIIGPELDAAFVRLGAARLALADLERAAERDD